MQHSRRAGVARDMNACPDDEQLSQLAYGRLQGDALAALEHHLGIAAELEADMQKFVDSYACEWKEAIESPEIMKRFRHFVNSDEPDPGIEFVTERGQPIPA